MSFAKVCNSWDVLKPVQSTLFSSIKSVALYRGKSGDCALLVTHDGAVYGVGKSTVGCLGLGDVKEVIEPCLLKEITNVSGVSMCGDYGDVLAITNEGQLYSWGYNSKKTLTPTLKSELSDHNIVDAKCCGGNYLALTKDGKVYQWRGVTFQGLSVIGTTPTEVKISEVVVSIACGIYSSLVSTKNGNVYAWGRNNSCFPTLSPIKINVFEEPIAKLACCLYYNLVLTHSGKIFSWGENSHGMGNANTSSTSVVQIGEHIENFVDIAVSKYRCAAAAENKSIYIWGEGATSNISHAPEYNEIHQCFAGSSCTSFLWFCKTSDSIDLEGFAGPLVEKLKNSFNCEDGSDLTLNIDGKKIYVHTLILKLHSNYFRTMLQEHWTDKNTREIKLSSFNYEAYMSYIWYLYSGEVKTSIENIWELWCLALEFDEENLKKACGKLMERNISFEDLAEQTALINKIKPDTYQEDIDESGTSLQSEHTTQNMQQLTLENAKLFGTKQKDLPMKLERLVSYYSRQKDELTSLQNKYTALQNKYTALQNHYNTLHNNNTILEKKYTALNKQYTALETKYTADQMY